MASNQVRKSDRIASKGGWQNPLFTNDDPYASGDGTGDPDFLQRGARQKFRLKNTLPLPLEMDPPSAIMKGKKLSCTPEGATAADKVSSENATPSEKSEDTKKHDAHNEDMDNTIPKPPNTEHEHFSATMMEMLVKGFDDIKNVVDSKISVVTDLVENKISIVSDTLNDKIESSMNKQATLQVLVEKLSSPTTKKVVDTGCHISQLSSESDISDDSNDEIGDDRYVKYSQRRLGSKCQSISTSKKNCKLPPFKGVEKWDVWFNRFEAVADRLNWTKADKLDELLPRLQGAAGDFVFSQLSKSIRYSYSKLTKELATRFKQVELSKSYQAQFSKRLQKPAESVEDYAVELKRLYDKGHAGRPHSIRQEDLLRRFLDGLADRKISHQVEFVKEPSSIDEAVVEIVSYQEATRRGKSTEERKNVYMVRPAEDSEDSEWGEDERVARLPEKGTKPKFPSKPMSTSINGVQGEESQKMHVSGTTDIEKRFEEKLNSLDKKLAEIQKNCGNADNRRSQPRNNGGNSGQVRSCFHCGKVGHIKKDCWNLKNQNQQATSNQVGQAAGNGMFQHPNVQNGVYTPSYASVQGGYSQNGNPTNQMQGNQQGPPQ